LPAGPYLLGIGTVTTLSDVTALATRRPKPLDPIESAVRGLQNKHGGAEGLSSFRRDEYGAWVRKVLIEHRPR